MPDWLRWYLHLDTTPGAEDRPLRVLCWRMAEAAKFPKCYVTRSAYVAPGRVVWIDFCGVADIHHLADACLALEVLAHDRNVPDNRQAAVRDDARGTQGSPADAA